MSKRPVPTGKERTFEFTELFFSTTDRLGIIQYGNDVFVQISGYERERLLGSPHNIIRHPDMPKAVFKLFWDTLHAGKMIAAFVKNMATDGSHYWVLAAAFPIGDKYLSIRLKPSSAIFEAAEAIYAKVLADEKTNGMDSAYKLLVSSVVEAGFKDYETFMTAALMAELKARDQQLATGAFARASEDRAVGTGTTGATISRIAQVADTSSRRYRNLFQKIGEFDQASTLFKEKTGYLLDTFAQFQLLSLNMRVFAAQIGEAGASLGVVSENFQHLVNEIEQYLKGFSDAVVGLIDGMQAATLQIASLKVQMDMVDFFVRESLGKLVKGNATIQQAFEGLDANSEIFAELSRQSARVAAEKMDILRKSINSFVMANREIKKFVNGIELISQMGAVEAARLNDSQQAFGHYIQRMREFSIVLRGSTQEIGASTRILVENLEYIEVTLKEVSGALPEIFSLAFALRTTSEDASPAAKTPAQSKYIIAA